MHQHTKSEGRVYLSPLGWQTGCETDLQRAIQFLLLHTLHIFRLVLLFASSAPNDSLAEHREFSQSFRLSNKNHYIAFAPQRCLRLSLVICLIRRQKHQARTTNKKINDSALRNLQSIRSMNMKISDVLHKCYWLPRPISSSISASTKQDIHMTQPFSTTHSVQMQTATQTLPALTWQCFIVLFNSAQKSKLQQDAEKVKSKS